MMKEYKNAPLDKFGLAVTIIMCFAALAIIFIALIYEVPKLFPLSIIIALVLMISISFIPKIYIENKVLTVKSLFSKTEIPLAEIEKINEPNDKFAFRTFGIGGVFGYYGRFNGNEKWFVTNRNYIVKIKLAMAKFTPFPLKIRNNF